MSDPGKSSEDALKELALDVDMAPSRAADGLWRQLNPELWERTNSPWAVLQTVVRSKRFKFFGKGSRRARPERENTIYHGMLDKITVAPPAKGAFQI